MVHVGTAANAGIRRRAFSLLTTAYRLQTPAENATGPGCSLCHLLAQQPNAKLEARRLVGLEPVQLFVIAAHYNHDLSIRRDCGLPPGAAFYPLLRSAVAVLCE